MPPLFEAPREAPGEDFNRIKKKKKSAQQDYIFPLKIAPTCWRKAGGRWEKKAGDLSPGTSQHKWNDDSLTHPFDFFFPKKVAAGGDEVLPGSSAGCFTVAAARGNSLRVSKLPCWH